MEFVDGKAGTSSKANTNATADPENAFKRDLASWTSGKNAMGLGPKNMPFPHLIWYDFVNRRVSPIRVSLRADQNGGDSANNTSWFNGPTKWQFIGSNDDICNEKSSWTTLCEDLSGEKLKRKTEIKLCHVTGTTAAFQCLGISVLDAPNESESKAIISTIRMWENGKW